MTICPACNRVVPEHAQCEACGASLPRLGALPTCRGCGMELLRPNRSLLCRECEGIRPRSITRSTPDKVHSQLSRYRMVTGYGMTSTDLDVGP